MAGYRRAPIKKRMVRTEDDTYVPESFYSETSPAYKAAHGPGLNPSRRKRSIPEQFAHDVVHGGSEIIRLGRDAIEKVKSGARKTLKFLRD